jgi:predicted DCC family thiol-disulfide oxidoreductase YuxK
METERFPRMQGVLAMKNAWTGGQYSLVRAVLAAYLLGHFLSGLVRGTEGLSNRADLQHAFGPMPVFWAAAVLSLFLGIGLYDRTAALGLWYIWVCLFGGDPLVGWLLLAHVFLPPAPYGSWAARGRVDPSGEWRMPPAIFAAAWGVLALTYAYNGYGKLVGPTCNQQTLETVPSWILQGGMGTVAVLELAFAPLALLPRLRPWLWTLMLLMRLALLVPLDFADRSIALLLLHLFAWDPGWIRPLPGGTERLFYDGHCGLCQRSVRLILAEDATGEAFRFAPLQGETFASLLSEAERASLPLSLVVRTETGTLLTRSAGVLHILRRLGGVWRLLAGLLMLLPTLVRDRLYDGVARMRHRLFARPAEVCPLMPPRLRARFDP